MRLLKKIFGNADEYLLAMLIAAICFVLILQVFCRYVLNAPLIWSEEVARYLFVWAVMIGLGYNIRTGTSISLRLLFNTFPHLVQVVLTCLTNSFLMVLFIICLPYAIRFTKMQANIMTAATEVPMSWVVVSIPIGFAYLIGVLAYDSLRTVARYRRERSTPA